MCGHALCMWTYAYLHVLKFVCVYIYIYMNTIYECKYSTFAILYMQTVRTRQQPHKFKPYLEYGSSPKWFLLVFLAGKLSVASKRLQQQTVSKNGRKDSIIFSNNIIFKSLGLYYILTWYLLYLPPWPPFYQNCWTHLTGYIRPYIPESSQCIQENLIRKQVVFDSSRNFSVTSSNASNFCNLKCL